MMNGRTYDRLITALEKRLKDLVSKDDDGKIDEAEFHDLCDKSKSFIEKRFSDHKDFITLSGEVDGDNLSFRVVYFNGEEKAAYDRTISFGVRSVISSLPKETRAAIEQIVDLSVINALAKKTLAQ